MTNHVVMFSGGAGSWYTGRRVIDTRVRPGDHVELIFADTQTEDDDLYRFLVDVTADLFGRAVDRGADIHLQYLTEGRDVWQIFFDVQFIGNTRIDPCSRILKRDLIRRDLEARFSPADTVVYLGIDWTEEHRFAKAQPYWAPFEVSAPLCERPFVDKDGVLAELETAGIDPPRLYAMGFPHNNCGGFCIKAGQGMFKLLLENLPERYAYHEAREQEFREHFGKDVAILRDRRGGTTKPLTLTALRQRVQGGEQVDEYDLGGCACFTPDEG